MYSEGSSKGILAILGAVVLAAAASNWTQTKFLLKFLWDLVVLNTSPILHQIGLLLHLIK